MQKSPSNRDTPSKLFVIWWGSICTCCQAFVLSRGVLPKCPLRGGSLQYSLSNNFDHIREVGFGDREKYIDSSSRKELSPY